MPTLVNGLSVRKLYFHPRVIWFSIVTSASSYSPNMEIDNYKYW